MIAFAYYLLKVTLCSGILFLYYFLFLRNKLFHHWNRFYLVIAVMLSLILPLVTFTVESETVADSPAAIEILLAVQSADTFVAEIEDQGSQGPSPEQWATYAYIFICLFLLVSMIISLYRIISLIRLNPVQMIDDIKVVETEVKGTPFSFFRFIFWNRKIDLQTDTGQQIFQHELVHAREGHSLDKLFLQAVLIPFWCNPVFWLIRNELRMVHEFIADKKAVGEKGTAALAAMIMQSVYPDHHRSLASHFFQSSLKRRIVMLSKIKNPRLNYFSRIVALPFLALIVLAFTLRTKEAPIKTLPLEKEFVVVIDAGHGKEDIGAHIDDIREKDITLAIAQQIKKLNRNHHVRIILTRDEDILPGLQERVQMARDSRADLFISLHVNAMPLDPDTGKPKADSSGIVIFIPGKEAGYQKESIRLGSILHSKLASVYPTSPTVRTRNNGVWVLNHNVCPNVLVECGYITNEKDRLFITSKMNQEAIAKKILSAIETYAFEQEESQKEKDSRTNILSPDPEAVRDTVPKKTVLSNTIRIKDQNISTGNGPFTGLIYINDKLFNGTLNEIPLAPDDIATISVLKGDHTKKFGEKGKNGVVLIYSKGYKDNKENPGYEITKKEEPVFQQSETPARINPVTWRMFVSENLDLKKIAKEENIPNGTYTVKVKFIVETDGSISDIQPITKAGFGLEEKVAELMKKSPRWEPAIQNKKLVRSYHTQPITFVFTDGEVEKAHAPEFPLKAENLESLLVPEGTELLSFEININGSGNQNALRSLKVTKNFTEETRKFLEQAGPGDQVTIENIICRQNGKQLKVPARIYRIPEVSFQ